MKEKKNTTKKEKYSYWTPRVLSVLFILFLSLFALDVFSLNLYFWGKIVALIMHLIPSIILTFFLIIAWKYELVGGIAFLSAGIIYIILLVTNAKLEWYMLFWSLIIAGPSFFIGILWILNWKKKKKFKKRKK